MGKVERDHGIGQSRARKVPCSGRGELVVLAHSGLPIPEVEQQHRPVLVLVGLSWVIHDQTPTDESRSTVFDPSCSRLIQRLSFCPAGPLLHVYTGEKWVISNLKPTGAGLETGSKILLLRRLAPSVCDCRPTTQYSACT